jgi:hypothetical protein
MDTIINGVQKWSNSNEGYISLLAFFITLILGLVTGLFKSLIKTPKVKVIFLEKMKFYSNFEIDLKFHNQRDDKIYPVHKTAFVVYMKISNIGNTPTSIEKIFLGYYTKKAMFWKKYLWLPMLHTPQAFSIPLKATRPNSEEKLLMLPTLITGGLFKQADLFLEIGKQLIGTVYFEGSESWGNHFPYPINDKGDIEIKIKIKDIYSKVYYFKTILRKETIENAYKYNSDFGFSPTISE